MRCVVFRLFSDFTEHVYIAFFKLSACMWFLAIMQNMYQYINLEICIFQSSCFLKCYNIITEKCVSGVYYYTSLYKHYAVIVQVLWCLNHMTASLESVCSMKYGRFKKQEGITLHQAALLF
jgi:hypothetical protein